MNKPFSFASHIQGFQIEGIVMEGGGRSKNLHLLCLALNNLLRDLKEALCDQRQMSTDLRLYFPCASAVEGGSSFVGGC